MFSHAAFSDPPVRPPLQGSHAPQHVTERHPAASIVACMHCIMSSMLPACSFSPVSVSIPGPRRSHVLGLTPATSALGLDAPLQLSESKACKAVAKAVMGHYSSDGANMVTRPHPALLPSPLRSSIARLPCHHCGPYHSLTRSRSLTDRAKTHLTHSSCRPAVDLPCPAMLSSTEDGEYSWV